MVPSFPIRSIYLRFHFLVLDRGLGQKVVDGSILLVNNELSSPEGCNANGPRVWKCGQKEKAFFLMCRCIKVLLYFIHKSVKVLRNVIFRNVWAFITKWINIEMIHLLAPVD